MTKFLIIITGLFGFFATARQARVQDSSQAEHVEYTIEIKNDGRIIKTTVLTISLAKHYVYFQCEGQASSVTKKGISFEHVGRNIGNNMCTYTDTVVYPNLEIYASLKDFIAGTVEQEGDKIILTENLDSITTLRIPAWFDPKSVKVIVIMPEIESIAPEYGSVENYADGQRAVWLFRPRSLPSIEVVGRLLEPIEISLKTYIPCDAITVNFGKAGYDIALFAGDGDKSSSFRAFQQAQIVFDPQEGFSLKDEKKFWGESKRYKLHQAQRSVGKPNWCWELKPSEWEKPWGRKTLPVTDKNNKISFEKISNTHAVVKFFLDGENPVAHGLLITPNLHYEIKVYVRQYNGKLQYYIEGDHSRFPAYQLTINGKPAYYHNPLITGDSPFGLMPGMEKHIDTGWRRL